MDDNIITGTDSYKVSQWLQYPKGLTKLGSYMESRGGQFDTLVWCGLQPILMNSFLGTKVITLDKIKEAKSLIMPHIGVFNELGWTNLLRKHGGRLPLKIKALPEGYKVQPGNALLTIENLDDEFPWLTNYIEGRLLKTWYTTSVATMSWHIRKMILKFLVKTGDPLGIDFKLHDFGYRGVSSEESAALGGASHLLSGSLGTDTIEAIRLLKKYYSYDYSTGLIKSIPASEHSTITSWGKDNEPNAMENILDQYPNGYVAIVSDSYDIFNACANILGGALRDKIIARNGTVVVRPDSGDPIEVVSKVLDILGEKFSYEVNSKGFKVLPPVIRVIQGDGVDFYSIKAILNRMVEHGWSADNIAFGMGGALLQKTDRDKQKFAIKASYGIIDGRLVGIHKDPITDQGKKSKQGLLRVRTTNGIDFRTSSALDNTMDNSYGDHLKTVFEMGDLKKYYTYTDVVANVNKENYNNG